MKLVHLSSFQSIREALRPDPLWGPGKPQDRTGRYAALTASINTAYVDDTVTMTGSHSINGVEDVEVANTAPPAYSNTAL